MEHKHREKKEIRQIIIQAARDYDTYLNDRDFLFLYYDKYQNIKSYEVSFKKNFFAHLTGVKYKEMKAGKFYDFCKAGTISFSQICTDRNPILIDKKLDVIPLVCKMPYRSTLIGKVTNYIPGNLEFTLAVANSKGQAKCVLGFDKNDFLYFPVTLLKNEITQYSNEPYKVIAVVLKKDTEDLYNLITYQDNSSPFSNLTLPKEIQKRIDTENIEVLAPSGSAAAAPTEKEKLTFAEPMYKQLTQAQYEIFIDTGIAHNVKKKDNTYLIQFDKKDEAAIDQLLKQNNNITL